MKKPRAPTLAPARDEEWPDARIESYIEQGCHCWGRWYGDYRFNGHVITCPFHGLPFDALMRGQSPAEINAARPVLDDPWATKPTGEAE